LQPEARTLIQSPLCGPNRSGGKFENARLYPWLVVEA
jgi:hypothetical protein